MSDNMLIDHMLNSVELSDEEIAGCALNEAFADSALDAYTVLLEEIVAEMMLQWKDRYQRAQRRLNKSQQILNSSNYLMQQSVGPLLYTPEALVTEAHAQLKGVDVNLLTEESLQRLLEALFGKQLDMSDRDTLAAVFKEHKMVQQDEDDVKNSLLLRQLHNTMIRPDTRKGAQDVLHTGYSDSKPQKVYMRNKAVVGKKELSLTELPLHIREAVLYAEQLK
jgi:hypothetical protein